jgi:hypothetical protein
VQHVTRDLLETAAGELVHQLFFERTSTFDADHLATVEDREVPRIVGNDFDIGIAKDRQGDIERAAAVARQVFTPAPVAVRVQRSQPQQRHRIGDDAAAAGRCLLGVAGRSRAGSASASPTSAAAVADNGGSENRRATTAGLPETCSGPIKCLSRSTNQGVCRGMTRLAAGSGTSIASCRPSPLSCQLSVAGRGRGQEQRREVILAAKRPVSAISCQHLAAVAWSEAEGAQAGVERALGPKQAQDDAIVVADKARRLAQGAIDGPQLVGTFRDRAPCVR